MRTTYIAGLTLLAITGTESISAERDVQIINILGAGGNAFIVNTRDEAFSLDGWRFSTQNST